MDISQETWDSDRAVDQLISQHDQTFIPIPDIECQPHLLISKVRKHYMEYLIKLLSVNYETNQRLLNKNIYLPSAIWRCAKNIETAAAQMCMVVQLYRQSIVAAIKELKNDTKKGKLNKRLYECLHIPPVNEKKIQTTLNLSENCNCECRCKYSKKRRKAQSPNNSQIVNQIAAPQDIKEDALSTNIPEQSEIPVLINAQVEQYKGNQGLKDTFSLGTAKYETLQNLTQPTTLTKTSTRISVESQESDELTIQLEKLFQADPNDDDLFDGAYSELNTFSNEGTAKKIQTEDTDVAESCALVGNTEISIMQSKSLDERIASLAGLLVTNKESNSTPVKPDEPKPKKSRCNRWLCEEYFLKSHLFELLDEIGDSNRIKLTRIKETLKKLFGDDSDDESLLSPLEETPEFVTSCKERIAPWVVKILTPYYIKGRIRGKSLFKSLAKHLIRLIYQCSHYPCEYKVKRLVIDFLETHKMIRCEADFKDFRIENL